MLIPGGQAIGITLESDGILVLGTGGVTGKDKSIIDFGTVPGEDPHLLTLVTCESSFGLGDKRIIVHAVLTGAYED